MLVFTVFRVLRFFPAYAKWLLLMGLSATDRSCVARPLWVKTANSLVFATLSAPWMLDTSWFFCFGGRGVLGHVGMLCLGVSFFMLYASPDLSGARNPTEVERQHLNRVASCLHSYSLHVIVYTADMDHINCRIDSLGSALGKHESPREALSIL